MLEPAFLEEAGWDPVTRVLSLPAQHRLLGRTVCRVNQLCRNTIRPRSHRICHGCFTRLTRHGNEPWKRSALPSNCLPRRCRAALCAVPGCGCVPTVRDAVLCEPHARKLRAGADHGSLWKIFWLTRGCNRCRRCRRAGLPRAPGQPTVRAATATPTTSGGATRWLPIRAWRIRSSGRLGNRGVAEPGRVNLRALPAGGRGRGAVRHADSACAAARGHRCGAAGSLRRAARRGRSTRSPPTRAEMAPATRSCGLCGPH